MLGTDFHHHTRRRTTMLKQSGKMSLKSPILGGTTLRMDNNNMVEVWIVGIWSAFGMLHLSWPEQKV